MSEDNSSSSPESKESEEDFNQPEIKNVVDEPDLSATESAEEAESNGLSLNYLGSDDAIHLYPTALSHLPNNAIILSNRALILVALVIATICCECNAFIPLSYTSTKLTPSSSRRCQQGAPQHHLQIRPHKQMSPTLLHNGIIIDVDDNFFTAAFFSIGLFYSLGKAYNRYLLEEVAFEQRKLEARERRLEEDPTLSELDLRREESEGWTSVYGKRSRRGGSGAEEGSEQRESKYRSSRVAVLDREEDEDEEEYGMTDDEIADFESRYGVEYDPYYDEPYEESELPVGKFKEDKSYGDRRYANGEVFYKDETTGMFYRQGSRPRQKKFWDLNSS
ncbi:predicted protein [Thalassiosira pseudonana CCMP1335]|uniref:Uncharacterized protein n=1 Tax=Thalassiosira pseudonana TaxID=35128 RepID=B8BZ54_THAPS|nr:predicted protein [Thalassiosira pseudonana CCMP1335]EED93287.1 predicted protein [Thalassiosira pseudonana CCMP1335]